MNRLLFTISVLIFLINGNAGGRINYHDDLTSFNEVVKALNEFSVDFYKTSLEDASENFISSPISIYMVLAMASFGSKGVTRQELEKVLHLPKNVYGTLNSIETITQKLNMFEPVYLRLGNKIFASNDVVIDAQYQYIISESFRSPVQNLNFRYPEIAASIINLWSSLFTHNHIKSIVNGEDLDANTALVLVNSVYFKGKWKVPFDSEFTTNAPFRINGVTKQVPMMSKKDVLMYNELPKLDARVVALPYEDGGKPEDSTYMYIILPKKVNGITELEKNIGSITLKELQSGEPEDVVISLPKFKIESTLLANDQLRKLGVQRAFTPDADFGGITNRPLSINKVLQKAFIEVDEEGTEAGASTSLDLGFRMLEREFIVDHPFLVVIATNDVILFTAKIVDPTV